MQADGAAWLFAPSGMLDGPLPTHYEPRGVRRSATRSTPSSATRRGCEWRRRDNRYARAFADPRFPYVLTTFRAHRAPHRRRDEPLRCRGSPSCMPEMFCEVSPELARERGLENGG